MPCVCFYDRKWDRTPVSLDYSRHCFAAKLLAKMIIWLNSVKPDDSLFLGPRWSLYSRTICSGILTVNLSIISFLITLLLSQNLHLLPPELDSFRWGQSFTIVAQWDRVRWWKNCRETWETSSSRLRCSSHNFMKCRCERVRRKSYPELGTLLHTFQ